MEWIKKLLSVIVVFILLSLFFIFPQLFIQITRVNSVGDTVIKAADKNGGFNDKTLALLDKMVKQKNLDTVISNVEYIPGTYIDVQKKSPMALALTYNFQYTLAFSNYTIKWQKTFIYKGISHKYFK